MKDRIRAVRKNSNLTQKEFAEKLGIKQNTVASYEMGRIGISDSVVISICREFGYREEWLRDGIEPKQPPKLEEDELAEYIEDLLSTESPTYTLIKSILNVYCKLDDKSRQIADSIIDKIIVEIKKETTDSEKPI